MGGRKAASRLSHLYCSAQTEVAVLSTAFSAHHCSFLMPFCELLPVAIAALGPNHGCAAFIEVDSLPWSSPAVSLVFARRVKAEDVFASATEANNQRIRLLFR